MGHTMAMPSVWAAWRVHPLAIMASAGYGRALVALGGAQHDHGPMPLVDPMNMQELTWSAGADLDVGHGFQVGGHALGGVPIGTGRTRVIGGGRVAWGTPRVSTAVEAESGSREFHSPFMESSTPRYVLGGNDAPYPIWLAGL
jgi:hypothetical protein